MGFDVRAGLLTALLGAALALAPAAQAEGLGSASVLANPALPQPGLCGRRPGGLVAASGGGDRFEVVLGRGGRVHALGATSAVGCDRRGELGTEAHRNPIVVYSRCPHAPFAAGPRAAPGPTAAGCGGRGRAAAPRTGSRRHRPDTTSATRSTGPSCSPSSTAPHTNTARRACTPRAWWAARLVR